MRRRKQSGTKDKRSVRQSGGTLTVSFPKDPPLLPAPRRWFARWGVFVWGCLLSAWLARAFFVLPAGEMHKNHERDTYAPRLVEFRDSLRHGYFSPQWCPHLWGGLGSPYFSYYQPTFFYVASLVPWSFSVVRGLGFAVFVFGLIGYGGMYLFLRRWFGTAAGVLGGTSLLLSNYSGTNIYIRGDFTEFAGMMLVPAGLASVAGLVEEGKRWQAGLLAFVGAALVTTHPCVALIGYPLLLVTGVAWGLALRRTWRAVACVAALVLGALLASFYAWPVLFESDLVHADRAFSGVYHYSYHFTPWRQMLGSLTAENAIDVSTRNIRIPTTLGNVLPILACWNLTAILWSWKRTTDRQRMSALSMAVALIASLVMMNDVSRWIWDHMPLLYRLQFPWRFLSIATPVLAALAGMVLPMRRMLGPWVAMAGVALLCVQAPFVAPFAIEDIDARIQRHSIPETVDDLLSIVRIVDAQYEWLPRTAHAMYDDTMGKISRWNQPAWSTAECHLGRLQLGQGRLAMQVDFPSGGRLVLRHFYFVEGWLAAVNDVPIALTHDRNGLMMVDLPPRTEGLLTVRFHGTSMRRWGWYVTTVCLVPLAFLFLPGRSVHSIAKWTESFRSGKQSTG